MSRLQERSLWLKAQVRSTLERLSRYHPSYRGARIIESLERRARVRPRAPGPENLEAAIRWLKAAQDATGDNGVSWGYRARSLFRSRAPVGWARSYPETTGYIIPTLIRYADLARDADSLERARRMADWEVSIQLPDGGFQGGIVGAGGEVSSSTFVTGQVLSGLVAAYRRFADPRYLAAAGRAGNFLMACLDQSGRFVRGFSRYCATGPKVYEIRTGLALADLGLAAERPDYIQGASRMADYAMSQQHPNGWFGENDLDDHTRPLTHTIGYTLEGLEGIDQLLHVPGCRRALELTLDAILEVLPADGALPGRFLDTWGPAVDWVCLTGNAQIAGVYLRSHARSANPRYLEAGQRLLGFVACTQSICGPHVGLQGGIRGSYPFDGEYGRWCVLNWATKFFADSTMDWLSVTDRD